MPCAQRLRRATLAAGLLATLGAAIAIGTPPARAAAVTPEQATALDAQMRAWVADWNAGLFDPAALPIRITPDGERFHVTLGPVAVPGATISDGTITASATPLEGGRWAVDDLAFPPKFSVAVTDAQPARQVSVLFDEQTMHGVIDPAFATESTMDGRIGGLLYRIDGAAGTTTARIKVLTMHWIGRPAGDGRLNIVNESSAEGYDLSQPMPDGTLMSLTMDRVRAKISAEQASFAQFGLLVRAATAMGASAQQMMQAGTDMSKPTPEQRTALHGMLANLGSLFTQLGGEETAEGIHVKVGDHGGSLARMALAGGIGAPGGDARITLRLALEGLDSAEIPPGIYRQLLPKRLVLAPRVSGVSKDALLRFIDTAIDSADRPDYDATADGMALLADHPVTIAIDELVLDAGPAHLTGTGELAVASPSDATGKGELKLTGLDALIKLTGTDPALKMAMPVLIFLKGIGEVRGKEVVWKITYADDKVLVNGTDLSAMIPHK